MNDAQRAEALRLADALDMTGAETPEGGDALDAAAALLRELAAEPAGWQPIETAPKDADVWVYGLAHVWVGSCQFFWQGQAGWDADDASWWTTAHDDKGEPLKVIPTHWMPLPAAPHTAR